MRKGRVVAAWLAACLGGGVQAEDVQFARDIVPIIKSSCVMCHLPGAAPGGLVLHPKGGAANLVGVPSSQSPLPRVVSGKPEESYLYHKLLGTHAAVGGSGERMPFGGMTLSEEQIDLFKRWIASGAKIN